MSVVAIMLWHQGTQMRPWTNLSMRNTDALKSNEGFDSATVRPPCTFLGRCLEVAAALLLSPRRGRPLVCAAGAALVVLLAVPSALGAQARLFAGSFGGAASTPANPYPLNRVESIAVDRATGNVYVSDPSNFRVERFAPNGQFQLMIGREVNKTAVEEGRTSEQNVCPAPAHEGDVCQPGTAGNGPGQFLEPRFLAVDNSTGSAQGDLYVANNGAVNEIQEVTVTATGGTFTLGFEGETTKPIAFDANRGSEDAGTVNGSLHERPRLKGINSQGGNAGPNFTLEFTSNGVNKYGGKDVPQVVCDGAALTGPGASCTVSTKRNGFSANLVEKLGPSGAPVTSWAEGGLLDAKNIVSPPAPVAGPFKTVFGMAVDAGGNLWVSGGSEESPSTRAVFEFDGDAHLISGFTGQSGELAVDAADNLYFNNLQVDEYTAAGTRIGVIAPSAQEAQLDGFDLTREAIDLSAGTLYLAGNQHPPSGSSEEGVVKQYEPASCNPVITREPPEPGCPATETFGGNVLSPSRSTAHPLAVDPATNALYVGDGPQLSKFAQLTVPDVTTTEVISPTATSATLTAKVNPGGVELNPGLAGCRFEWGTTAAPYEHQAPCDKTPAEIGTGSAPVEVRAAITGLSPGVTYHYRVVAANANDVNSSITEPAIGADATFGPPLLESSSPIDVNATGATLEAAVDPNGLDTGVRIEYGTAAGVYTAATTSSDLGAGSTSATAVIEIAGLTPGTEYHYRAVAENVLGEGAEAVLGPDRTFTTQTNGEPELPDHRGWELVSPVDKHGGRVKGPTGAHVTQAAADGNAFTYATTSPTEAGAAGNSDNVQVLSTRTPAGWSSRDLATPQIAPTGGSQPSEYELFSTDLSLAAVEPLGEFDPAISGEASEQTPFLRTNFSPGAPDASCELQCYRPLVTGAPGFANVPTGTHFGHILNSLVGPDVGFLGASADLRHSVINSVAPLVEGAPGGLYEWTEGRIALISLRPGGALSETANLGSAGYAQDAISPDGAHVIWSETPGVANSEAHLYEANTETDETVQIDVNRGGSGQGAVTPVYQGASANDEVVYFTDEQRLTADSGAVSQHRDLYRCQIIFTEAGGECELADLTPETEGQAASADGVLGTSEDGGVTYFVADGVLAGNTVDNGSGSEQAQPGNCSDHGGSRQSQREAHCNLYMWRAGTTTFITRLLGADSPAFGGHTSSVLSPDGQWLAFMSERSLTGYDNRDRETGAADAETYIYDADSPGAAPLHCVSCDPSGRRPHGVEYVQLTPGRAHNDNVLAWEGAERVSGFLPGVYTLEKHPLIEKPHELSDAGRLEFNSLDGLVPQDANGAQDVYEYEPSGVGTCDLHDRRYIGHLEGCLGLLSGGMSGEESVLQDTSRSGDDVFFMTTAKLSPLDLDSAYDIYDARVGGGDAPPAHPIECQGDSCQAFVEAPADTTPGSLIFSGPGNLKPLAPAVTPLPIKKTKCPKGRRLKHKKCLRSKPKRRSKGHNSKPRTQAHHGGRTGR